MKQQHFLLTIVALVVTLTGSTLLANDNDDDKLFGRGRFLRRMRKEFSAEKDPKSKKEKKTKKDKANKGKSPTLATDAKSTPRSRTNSKQKNDPNRETAPLASDRSTKTTTLGFGMLIESRKDSIVVSTMDRRGNAATAGIKPGDIITGVGGIEITSISEINQITTIVSAGDQIEFQITRKGKPQKVLVQFGTAPDPDTAPTPIATTHQPNAPMPSLTGGQIQSSPIVIKQKPQIISASAAPGLQSVMSLPRYRSARTKQATPAATSPQRRPTEKNIIQTQRDQIEQMKREIIRLRKTQESAPTRNGHSILNSPGI